MAWSHTSTLYVVDLVFYIIVFSLTLYLGYRHGKHAILGYFYLNLCCAVRIVADIVSVVDETKSGGNGQPSIAAAVLGSIGLSPLMLSLAGFLHEIHHYLLIITATSDKAEKRTKRWMWFAQFQIHGVVATGMVLLIVGTVELFSATSNKKAQSDDKLRSAGAVVLLVLHLNLVMYAAWLLHRCVQMTRRLTSSVLWLARWTVVAGLVILVKVAYAVAYTFDHKDAAINPVTGSFAVKVILVVVVFLVAVIVLVVGGWMSKDIASSASYRPARDSESGTYESYRVVNMPKSTEGNFFSLGRESKTVGME